MQHTSIKLNTPIEFINVVPVNPLISKCEIKVCYVGDEPNRNKTTITKETAKEMANSLPGSPIVGYFNFDEKDYEEHNEGLMIQDNKLIITSNTKPYGFVDLGAKVWFQKFLDDGEFEREYLMTEGYLWTGQYPECQRVIDKGNNQSMELDKKNVNGSWTKNENGEPEFFIINEAIFSKLCILGEDFEPCFEGATITAPTVQFAFDESFTEKLQSMIGEIKDLLDKGGNKVFTTYAVEIGDALWRAIYDYINTAFPADEDEHWSKYCIEGIYEEEGQKFVILKDRTNATVLNRMDFTYTEEGFVASNELTKVEITFVPSATPQFAPEAVAAFELEYSKKDEDNKEEKCPECGKPLSECDCDEDDKSAKKYILEEIPEYIELQNKYSELETKYAALETDNTNLNTRVNELTKFKLSVEKVEKQNMIDSFYMLSDTDKADVIANIDSYSLDDIEAKLSIICVRNKVNFNLQEEGVKEIAAPVTTYNLQDNPNELSAAPAWFQRAIEVSKSMN